MRFEPHAYQQYAIDRVITDNRLALWLDMGLGKTAITLTAINDLKYNRLQLRKALIIAPKRVAEATWQNEAAKWDHLKHLRISTVLGSAQKRIRALNTPADIYITGRENTQWLVDYYRNDWPFDMLVLDESSSFKNHQAKRFKALRLVTPRTARIVELTGTPSPKGLIDLWAQIYLLDEGERLGQTIGGFRERYFLPDKRNRTTIFSYAPKSDSEQAIHERVADIAVSMKAEDWLELPDLIYNTIPVVLEPKAQAAYSQLERDMLLELEDETVTVGTAGVLTGKLLQLCNGAVYDLQGGVTEIHSCKVEALLELLEGLPSALVFYSFKHDLTRLLPALKGYRVQVYQGPQDEVDWNSGEIDVLLAHPASCAYGLNLQQGGRHVVWFGLQWSLELYQQANKRLHRQGQRGSVMVHHLAVQGGVDEDVLQALESKADTQEALLQALKARIGRVRDDQRTAAGVPPSGQGAAGSAGAHCPTGQPAAVPAQQPSASGAWGQAGSE